MLGCNHIVSLAQRARYNQSGSVAIIFAICMMPVLLAAAAALDYSRISHTKSIVSQSLDAAVIATAKSLSEGAKADAKLEQAFKDFFYANLELRIKYSENVKIRDFRADEKSGLVEARIDVDVPMALMGIVGKDKVTVPTASRVVFDKQDGAAVSLFLVLDKSGSMHGQGKIGTLKIAIAEMAAQFEKNDPEAKFVRTGAVSYNHERQAATGLAWGASHVNAYAQLLEAEGGTSSTDAVATALQAINRVEEAELHGERNGQTPRKVMVFMTDGNNNRSADDQATRALCSQAKASGVEIYSIAFKAPVRGQQLLKNCASSVETYFDAQNRQQLVDAFVKIGADVTGALVLSM